MVWKIFKQDVMKFGFGELPRNYVVVNKRNGEDSRTRNALPNPASPKLIWTKKPFRLSIKNARHKVEKLQPVFWLQRDVKC